MAARHAFQPVSAWQRQRKHFPRPRCGTPFAFVTPFQFFCLLLNLVAGNVNSRIVRGASRGPGRRAFRLRGSRCEKSTSAAKICRIAFAILPPLRCSLRCLLRCLLESRGFGPSEVATAGAIILQVRPRSCQISDGREAKADPRGAASPEARRRLLNPLLLGEAQLLAVEYDLAVALANVAGPGSVLRRMKGDVDFISRLQRISRSTPRGSCTEGCTFPPTSA